MKRAQKHSFLIALKNYVIVLFIFIKLFTYTERTFEQNLQLVQRIA